MTWPARVWRRAWRAAGAALALAAAPALAGTPARVISLNMCTDQLLLDLAAPGQILGLSPYAHDRKRAWALDRARAYPALSGTAEEVLMMRPDLVVTASFSQRATREFIRDRGIPIAEFDDALTIAEAQRQITRMGALVGAEERARHRNREIDAALERLRAVARTTRLRVLPVSRRGWVSGEESLMSDLLNRAGLVNIAGELGFAQGGFASLEAIVRLKPDAILVSRDTVTAEDQGSAKLMHPALIGRFPPERRLVVPERLTVCGGPMIVEAIEHLARGIARLADR